MASTLKLRRFGAAALTAGLLLAAPASASDTFFLKNQSTVASLTGTSLWGKGNTMNSKCRSGPFPGPTLTAFTFNPGQQGSITLSQNPFSDCQGAINPLTNNPITSPYLTGAEWNWIIDDPVVGFGNITCYVIGGYGTQPIESGVDGWTCTVYDPSPEGAGHFSSSAAPVRGGKAVAFVQHFPGSQAGAPQGSSSSARYELSLRDKKGRVHGRNKATIISGNGQRVRIPITKELQEQVAEKGYVKVKAVLKRSDGQPGVGDRTVLRVMKDHKSLPF
jgi:hypothetical protein